MSLRDELVASRGREADEGQPSVTIPGRGGQSFWVDPRRLLWGDGGAFSMVRDGARRRLLVIDVDASGVAGRFHGEHWQVEPGIVTCCADLDHTTAVSAREVCAAARPCPVGLASSFGLGDRLGIARAAHLRALRDRGFRVVLAQQSIRELERTGRTAEDVLDAATWAAIDEAWTDGWGADADHLKAPADVRRMAAAGFTMFTIDPGDHVVDAADTMAATALREAAIDLPWQDLEDSLEAVVRRYAATGIRVGPALTLEPSAEDVLRALVKYGAALAHCARMYRDIAAAMRGRPFEVEISVDETASVTTPFEHWLVASELRRLGVEWVGLAPRFVGDFEKGIDYRGDLELFRREYLKHLTVATAIGPYKISIHSGSDKFSIYRVIGEFGKGGVHVKTAGTSYLEALRTVASHAPPLFSEILDFSREAYEEERRSYHVSAELDRVPPSADVQEGRLASLLDDDDARQVLHVTYGRVLTAAEATGGWRFKTRLLATLETHEAEHHDNLVRHFRRHTAPFRDAGGGTR